MILHGEYSQFDHPAGTVYRDNLILMHHIGPCGDDTKNRLSAPVWFVVTLFYELGVRQECYMSLVSSQQGGMS